MSGVQLFRIKVYSDLRFNYIICKKSQIDGGSFINKCI